jgi:predicted NAD/FAD-binding protein
MVSVRREVRITRDGGEPREAETEPAERDETEDGDLPPTSVEDLALETEPSRFDRTFLSSAADLTIQGAFDPAPGAKQVLPRLAYTINYNYVYNPNRGRWEPDEGKARAAGEEVPRRINTTADLSLTVNAVHLRASQRTTVSLTA